MTRVRSMLGAAILASAVATGATLFDVTLARQADPDAVYEQAMDALDAENWRRAAELFGQVADTGRRRADAALYWKAYALGKKGERDAAGEALRRLRREHPDSRWLRDAEALSIELRGGGRARDRVADEELKLLALQGLMNADPDRAMPILREFIEGDQSAELKSQALFVLLQSGRPEGRKLVVSVASDPKQPLELREDAIQHLAVMGSLDELERLYEVEESEELREALLEGFMIGGRRDRILDAARNETSEEVRETAIELLGALGATDELWDLYQKERSEDVREEIVQSFMATGDRARLLEIARNDASREIRGEAAQMLGASGARKELEQLYREESSEDVREEILHGFMIMGAREPILAAARDEPSEDLRGEAIQLLGVMGATRELRELIEREKSEDVREEIVQALAIAGDVDFLVQIARGRGPIATRIEAVEALGISGGKRTGAMLVEIYDAESDPELKEAAIEALALRGEVRELIRIARRETDPELKREAVQQLALMGTDEAEDFMMELLED